MLIFLSFWTPTFALSSEVLLNFLDYHHTKLHHYLTYLSISPVKFFSPFSIRCFSASLWRFTRYSFLILLSPLHLIFPSEASHPPFSSVFFFLLPAGTWLFVTCSIMELFPQYFMKITSESVFFQQFSSYFSDSGWVGRVTAGGKSLILIKNNC